MGRCEESWGKAGANLQVENFITTVDYFGTARRLKKRSFCKGKIKNHTSIRKTIYTRSSARLSSYIIARRRLTKNYQTCM